jgi:hypothetical protein
VTTDPSRFSVGDLHARAAGQKVINDFLGENVGLGEIVGFFAAFVSEPEDVEVGFIVIEPLFVLFKPSPYFLPFANYNLATFLLLL